MGKVSLVGAGMKSHPGVAAKTFTHARRRRREHRDDLHLADQDLLRDRARATWTRRSGSCTRAFELGDGAIQPEDVSGVHRPVVS